MEDNWENPYEEDGVTLGPEEALRRETDGRLWLETHQVLSLRFLVTL